VKLALAGDTMLGRGVAERLTSRPLPRLFSDDLVAVIAEADLFVVNLECAISDRGQRWPDPRKPFFFRTPPIAVDVLRQIGVGGVILANNHALDFGVDALLDTLRYLDAAGIGHAGAGVDEPSARAPAIVARAGTTVGFIGVTDHPAAYAAGPARPGVSYADLRHGSPAWLLRTIGSLDADIVVVSPHWGPNMAATPAPYIRSAAAAFRHAGATVVAGHSAHVFHGVDGAVLYDLGDFLDDYRTDPDLRNDLGLLFLVTFDGSRPVRLEAVPLALDYCHTRLADATEAAWIARRFRTACAAFGTEVVRNGGRFVIEWNSARRREVDDGEQPHQPRRLM
jgi:poly-gamma-glutamate synthesis protein (capsule biosynthesis protein)